MKIFKTQIVSLHIFQEIVLDNLVHGMEHYTPRDICRSFMEDGVTKLDKDNLGAFVKSLQGKVFLPTMCVDIGDGMFYWLVTGTDAILVRKEQLPLNLVKQST